MTKDRSEDPPTTAAKLMAELRRDPKFVARSQEQERQQRENVKTYREAAEPVLKELATAGLQVESVGELKGGPEYPEAIPILLQWLPKVTYLPLKEDIVRTLSVPWAKPAAAPVLIEEFRRPDDSTGTGIRWAIANGLEVIADDAVFDDIVELVRDKRFGRDCSATTTSVR